MNHIVALSGGKDSSAMALRLQEMEPDTDFTYLITPTGNELPEMFAHWKRLVTMLGKPLTVETCGRSIQALIRDQMTLPNYRMRYCTRMIKIEPFQKYLLAHSPCVSYVGIRADEADFREGVDHSKINGVTNRYPLVEWGWREADVRTYLDIRKVDIPKRTDCAMCFYQRLGEWWLLWRDNPKHFTEAEGFEGLTGHTLRSEGRDSWPAALKDLRKRFEAGLVPRGADQMDMDLGVASRSTMCSFCAR